MSPQTRKVRRELFSYMHHGDTENTELVLLLPDREMPIGQNKLIPSGLF